VQVGGRDEANRVIDAIRAGGGFIESVSNSSSSLEDVFIRTTRGEKAA
jgi:hypothetical protein